MKTKSVVSLIVTIGLWLGPFSACSSGNKISDEPIKITAEDLFKAYHANEGDADRQYKGKTLTVTGWIGDADPNDRSVTFVDPQKNVLLYAFRMAADQVDAISKLKLGQRATIKGICDGKAKILGVTVDPISLKESVIQ